MRKWAATILLIISVLSLTACKNMPLDEPNEDIYKAKDYAISVFRDTMPEDCILVKAKGSVGDVLDDSIYYITLTYTVGDSEEEFAHRYKISVDGSTFTILEETPSE